MARKYYRLEDIIANRRKADILIRQSKTFAKTRKKLAVSDINYYR